MQDLIDKKHRVQRECFKAVISLAKFRFLDKSMHFDRCQIGDTSIWEDEIS